MIFLVLMFMIKWLGHEFPELIQVLIIFFMDLFFSSTSLLYIDFKKNIGFMVFFNFFIGLSQSHDLTYEYDELIQVGLCLFIPFSCIFF
jgi:hypothetical protein